MKITDDLLDVVKMSRKDIIAAMDGVEDWVIENKEIDGKINKFLNDFDKINKRKTIDKQSFLQLLAYLHTGDVLKIINVTASFDESFCKELVALANNLNEKSTKSSKFAKIFSDRLLIVYRMNALPRVFSKERMDAVAKTVGDL